MKHMHMSHSGRGIQAKKSLGQNFLKSKKALLAMVKAGEVVAEDTVVEIGPGKGALTRVLLETGAKVIAFEKDHRLIELLTETFDSYIKEGKFELYERDILEVEIGDYILDPNVRRNDVQVQFKLIANIPYYITGEITRRFLTSKNKPKCIVLLVQKEVAERIVDSKESILALSVKAYGAPRKIMTVKKEMFTPSPKVDSAIIKISDIQNPFKDIIQEQKFFEVIKKAFGQKRKKLNTTLKDYKEIIKNWEEIKDSRPEDLNVEKWLEISESIS